MISGGRAPPPGLGRIGGVAASAVRRGTERGAVAVEAPLVAQNVVQQRNKKKQVGVPEYPLWWGRGYYNNSVHYDGTTIANFCRFRH